MATDRIRISTLLPVAPGRVYSAWLDPREHRAMTGGKATVTAEVGGEHTAWDGYIRGTILALEPGRRIVQSWRTSEFPEASPDSRLEVVLEEAVGGTRVTILHTEVPAGDGEKYEKAWVEFYFDPMREYFAKPARKVAPSPAGGSAKPEAATAQDPAAIAKPAGRAAKRKPAKNPARRLKR